MENPFCEDCRLEDVGSTGIQKPEEKSNRVCDGKDVQMETYVSCSEKASG